MENCEVLYAAFGDAVVINTCLGRGLRMWLQERELKWGLSVNKWSDVKCSDVEWTDVIIWSDFVLKWSELRW
jgi:hypothetical protein